MPASAKTKESAWVALILFAVFVGIFALTWLTPMVADDYNYAFSWSTARRVESLRDVYSSMDCHRLYSNGRVFAHGFVQVFSFLPHWFFALCNALVVTGQAFFLHLFLRREGRAQPLTLLGALFLLWICMPVFGQAFLWQDGACNYSWGLFLSLALVYPFYAAQAEGGLTWPVLGKLLYLPLSFVAGAWSEHISFSLMALGFFLLLLFWIRKRRFPGYLFLLLLGSGLGYLYMMLAPSMLGGRSSGRGELSLAALAGMWQRLADLLRSLPGGLMMVSALLVLGLVLILFCALRGGKKAVLRLLFVLASAACALGFVFFSLGTKKGLYGFISSSQVGLMLAFGCFFLPFTLALFRETPGERLVLPFLLFLGGFCALLPFLFARYLPARGCVTPVLYSILAGVLVLRELGEGRGLRRAFAATALVFALFFGLGTADILAVHRSETERQRLIREALQGNGIVTAPAHPVRSKYSAQYGLSDLSPDPVDSPNDVMATYYGVRQIILAEEEPQP